MYKYFQFSWLAPAALSCALVLPVTAQPITQPTAQPQVATAPQSFRPQLPAFQYVPREYEIHLLLKVSERQVYVYRGQTLLRTYPVAVGKKGWETPLGDWRIQEMAEHPGWINFKNGKFTPPGPQNPLGERWIGFWMDDQTKNEIGFHGTPDLSSIGKAASHGCVRMKNQDVKDLYRLVQIGTVVRVRS